MNSLDLHLPQESETPSSHPVPGPEEITQWLKKLPEGNLRATAPIMLGLLRGLNAKRPPASQHLQSLTLLRPNVHTIVDSLRSKYRNQPLPLENQLRVQASLSRQLLEEIALGYKCIVYDLVQNSAGKKLNNDLLIAALKQSIVQLGQQLLESYIQYRIEPTSVWGELHRLYRFAERNGLGAMPAKSLFTNKRRPTTIQQAYIRNVLLGLTQPNHLLSGQVEMIYDYLAGWTSHVRIKERMDTLAETGDMLVDLDSDQPPITATSRTRFRPIDGRHLDISQLKKRLQQALEELETDSGQSLPLAQRLYQDMLLRLDRVWAGRGERGNERDGDGKTPVMASIGLEAAHHYIGNEKEFSPEGEETQWRKARERPPRDATGAEGLSIDRQNARQTTKTDERQIDPLESGFITVEEAWSTHLYMNLPIHQQNESKAVNYAIVPWRRINHSEGGLALRLQATSSGTKTYVGSLLAFRDDKENQSWRVGVIRWLQNNSSEDFDIGIQALADYSRAVAVRALTGTGSGGEYFRSLIIGPLPTTGDPQVLVVPANIFAPGTQLLLNRDGEISFIKLTGMIETSGRFSVFAFEATEEPFIKSDNPSKRTAINTGK